jgi:hypothetical protein
LAHGASIGGFQIGVIDDVRQAADGGITLQFTIQRSLTD